MRQFPLLHKPAMGIHPIGIGIEPSALGNRIAWYLNRGDKMTVSGSGNITTWIDNFLLGNDITQATEANKPLALMWESVYKNYLYTADDGNYASTPDSPSISITGDIDIRCLCRLADWQGGGTGATFISKFDIAGNKSWSFHISNGILFFTWSENGTMLKSESTGILVSFTGNQVGAVRVTLDVDNGAGAYLVTFYESLDAGDTWTSVWSGASFAGTTSIFDSTAQLQVGASQSSLTIHMDGGKIYNASVRSGIGGTLVANFNADKGSSYSPTFTASTGEVWTIVRDAVYTTYKAIIVDENMAMFNSTNWLKKAIAGLIQPCTIYIFCNLFSWVTGKRVYDGNTNGTGQIRLSVGSPNIAAFAGNALDNGNYDVNEWRVITVVFNGVTSFIKIDQVSDVGVSGNAGASNMSGFTLGASGSNTNGINMAAKEIIIYSAAHDAATRASLISNIASRHGYALT